MQAGHGTVGVCIVENCEVSATEGWADLQRAGMHSARILRQYYEGRVRDRAIALHLMDLKQAEHDGWLALVAPEYAGAAKCSLLIEQLSYELGESSAEQLAALCAISDSEIELSSAQFKDDLQMCSKNNRWIRSLPLCCNAACGKPLPQARPLCCAQCRAVVYCDKTCQTQAWKAGHKHTCVPYAPPGAPAVVTTAEPGIPWQYAGHLQAPSSAGAGYEHVSQRGVFDILKKKGTKGQSASMVDMFARLACAERAPSAFEPPEGQYLGLEQVAAYVHSRALKGCASAIHDTYDLMTFEGDTATVKQVVSYQSAWMRAAGPLVFVSKTTYHHLHALWRQNNVDIYKLRITCEKWTYNVGLCRTIEAELKTTPAPGRLRMLGFAGDTVIVAEVPEGDATGIAQHLDLHMLN